MLLNVKDFPSVQAALDAAAEGDRIYLPGNGAGTVYSPPPTSAWKITKSLEIFGDGPGEPGSERGTSLKRGSASNLPIFEITPAAGSSELGTVVIRGMKLFRPSVDSTSSGEPLAIKCTVPSGGRIRSLQLDRIVVNLASGATGDGVGLDLNASPGMLDNLSMTSCYVTGLPGFGIKLKRVGLARLNQGGGGKCTRGLLRAEASGVYASIQEAEGDGLSPQADQAGMRLESCTIAHVEACRYEAYYKATIPTGLEFRNCAGAVLANCNSFVKGSEVDPVNPPPPGTIPTTSSIGIKVAGSTSADNCPAVILTNNFIRIFGQVSSPGAMVDVANSNQGCVVFPQFDDGQNAVVIPGSIKLPGYPNKGLVAWPTIASRGFQPQDNRFAGMIIPSGSSLPTVGVQNGMLFCWQAELGIYSLYVRINNAWRKAVTG